MKYRSKKRALRRRNAAYIVEKDGKFGIDDRFGNVILPAEYDYIKSASSGSRGKGFIFSSKGKWGYIELDGSERSSDAFGGYGTVNGCASAYLACIYSRIDVHKNGLALYIDRDDGYSEYWFDVRSRILYRDMEFDGNFGDFDCLTAEIDGIYLPTLKKAGKDAFVVLPDLSPLKYLNRLPLDNDKIGCIICVDDDYNYDDEEAPYVPNGYVYYFLILLEDGWYTTEARRTLTELYRDLPSVRDGIEARKNGGADVRINPYIMKSEITDL